MMVIRKFSWVFERQGQAQQRSLYDMRSGHRKAADMNMRINEETVNDRAKLILHRLIARRLAREPDLIDAVRSRLVVCDGVPDHVKEWDELLRLEPQHIRRALTSRSERMERLRLSSPFSSVSDFRDPAFRKRVWRLARRGMSLPSEEKVTERGLLFS